MKLAKLQNRSRPRARNLFVSTAAATFALVCSLYGFSALPAGATLLPTSTVPGSSISTNAIACPTATLCLAGASAFSNSQAAIVKINGATGAASLVPSTATTNAPVAGIACPSATQCVGVSGVTYSFAVNGSNGKIGTANNNPTSSIYYSVACPSATSCLAGSGTAPPFHTGLTPMSVTGVPGTTTLGASGSGEVDGLACVSATRCYGADAVGAGTGAVLVINSDAITSQFPTTFDGQAIACSGAAACVMVGFVGEQAYAAPVNPTTGQPGTRKALAGMSSVSGVTCVTATTCIAVGYHLSTTGKLSARYSVITNGVPTANKALFGQSLAGIACPTASTCWAVGENHKGVSIVDSVPVP